MNAAERWSVVEEMLHRSLELPPSAREAFLAATCDDEAVRREVQALLRAHDAAGPLGQLEDAGARATTLEWVGPYRLLRHVGEGGMGVVYLAERSGDGFTQTVALKLLRAGIASEHLAPRMARERSILARLEHPGIARFVDGGSTPSGQPYFAMEYVEGVNLIQYCGDNAMPVRQRLEIFVRVCDAVQYAHRQLVVHRDLKPANILVSSDGRPKLLDFGLAKLLEEDGEVDATQTAPWLTPAYASPEQVRRQRVSTLTDVYALGVVLYELLSGRRPLDVAGLPPAEMARVICERAPAPPGSENDLDIITLKALAKEPERRYGSAGELADDIRRFLDERPILARSDTLLYRASKFVLRHRRAVGAGAVAGLLLIAGVALTLWQAHAARLARDRAQVAMQQSEDVTAFLLRLFQASDPNTALGDTTAAREVLRRGLAEAEMLRGAPVLQARMFDALGQIYQNLERYDEAERLLTLALTLRRGALGREHMDVAQSLDHLGTYHRYNAAYALAESLYHESLAIKRRLVGPDHPEIATTLGLLGYLMPYVAKGEESERFYRHALDMERRSLPVGHLRISTSLINHASALSRLARFDEAEAELRDGVRMRESHQANDPASMAEAKVRLADFLANVRGSDAAAEPLYRESLALQRRVYGPRHMRLAHVLSSLADLHERQGKPAEAEKLLREILSTARASFGAPSGAIAWSMGALAGFLQRQKRYAEAESLRREEIAEYRAALGPEHPTVAGSLAELGGLLTDLGRYQEADRLLVEAFNRREKASGPTHNHLPYFLTKRAHLFAVQRRYEEAEAQLKRAMSIAEPQWPDNHETTRLVLRGFVDLYAAWGRHADADAYHRRLR